MKNKKFTDRISLGKAKSCDSQLDFSGQSNSDLLNDLENKMSTMSEDDFDFTLVDKYLNALQDRAPVMTDYDSASEFTRLQDKHSLIFENDYSENTYVKAGRKNKPKAIRFLRITEITVAAVLCLTVSASAMGFNPIKLFIRWAEDILQVQGSPSGVMELPENSGSQYKSLEDALAKNGADFDGCPTWIPEDYQLIDVSVKISEGTSNYMSYYISARGDLLISVIIDNTAWVETSEKNAGGYIYQKSDQEYYIVTNVSDTKAGWINGSYSYLISGRISEVEIKKMIDSIQRM